MKTLEGGRAVPAMNASELFDPSHPVPEFFSRETLREAFFLELSYLKTDGLVVVLFEQGSLNPAGR